MYKVIHLIDITMANGRGLNLNFINNKQYTTMRNTHNWPNKYHVTSNDYRCWKDLLKWLFPLNNYNLYSPLAEWSSTNDWKSNWDWYTSGGGEFIFHHVGENKWHRHLKVSTSHRAYHKQYMTLNQAPTDLNFRASIHLLGNSIRLLNTSSPSNGVISEAEDIIAFDVVSLSKPKVDWFMHRLNSSL